MHIAVVDLGLAFLSARMERWCYIRSWRTTKPSYAIWHFVRFSFLFVLIFCCSLISKFINLSVFNSNL